MFVEVQSRANIFVRSAVTSYRTGYSSVTTTTEHEGEGLDGLFDPVLQVGGYAEKRVLEDSSTYEEYTEQVLTHLCDAVPMRWTLTVELLDLNDFTTTERTDVVTLIDTVTYTLRCTAVGQRCTIIDAVLTLPV